MQQLPDNMTKCAASWSPDHQALPPRVLAEWRLKREDKKAAPPLSCPHPTIQQQTQTPSPPSNTENQYGSC